jgi:hypothetical protein
MNFDSVTVQPAASKGKTGTEQPRAPGADALLAAHEKLYWEYLGWRAQRAIREIDAAVRNAEERRRPR